MKYEKLIELYVRNLKAPDERMRTDRMGEVRASRPQVRDPSPWRDFVPSATAGSFKDLTGFDKEKLWIWSDLHFFHNNIIRYTGRPYSNSDHMNRALLENFRKTVGPNDVSIWVGDVTFERGGTHVTNSMLASLPGYKILVFGNHDLDKTGKLRSLYFDEIHSIYRIGNLIFTHYPWNAHVPDGYYGIHGHTHDTDTGNRRRVNVSVEKVEFKPISLASLIETRKLNYKEEV
jgi:calcineurin-like phosphoesterase family protein